MNFLLHRHLAALELASAEAGVGAMLPDLWRMADRRMRPRREVTHPGELQRGVAHHLEADAWFHATEVFTEGERALGRELVTVGAQKLVLFAHATWEMCLDGALLLARGIDAELAALRRDIAESEPRFADLSAAHGADALAEPGRFAARMTRLLEGLTDGAWIAGYQCGEGLAERLAGMRMRFGLPHLPTDQQRAVERILQTALVRAEAALPTLLSARVEKVA